MTTTNDPDAIRAEIDATRERLSNDVEQLSTSVRPSSMAQRTARRATSRAARLKDSVMGSAHGVADSGGERVSGLTDAVTAAPDAALRQTRGNPLAAGAVALAAGWLVGSLLPSSEAERRMATVAKDQAEPLVPALKERARETVEHLKEPVREAAGTVQQTAQDAASRVADGSSAPGAHTTVPTSGASPETRL